MLIILSFDRSSLKSCLVIMFDKAIFDVDARKVMNFDSLQSQLSFNT